MTFPHDFKKAAKYVAYWTLPLGIQNIIKAGKRELLKSKNISKKEIEEKRILQQNKSLKNIHKGERCFILATGPSIKSIDLKQLKHEYCIAVSHFYLHPDFHVVNPQYYCIAPWHPSHPEEAYNHLLSEIGSVAKKANFFIGISEYDRVPKNQISLGERVNFLGFGASSPDLITQGLDLCKPILSPNSVSIMALQVAISLGFKEIYLLGFDHNSICNKKRDFAFQHFYTEEKSILVTDVSDFKRELQCLLDLWSQYETLKEIADLLGVNIINATNGSYLDVFTHIDSDIVFKKLCKT